MAHGHNAKGRGKSNRRLPKDTASEGRPLGLPKQEGISSTTGRPTKSKKLREQDAPGEGSNDRQRRDSSERGRRA